MGRWRVPPTSFGGIRRRLGAGTRRLRGRRSGGLLGLIGCLILIVLVCIAVILGISLYRNLTASTLAALIIPQSVALFATAWSA